MTRHRSTAGSTPPSPDRVAPSAGRGNAGQERAETEDDFGWIMGRVHTAGQVTARELVSDIAWTVVDTVSDVSENELEGGYGRGPLRGPGQAAGRTLDRARPARRVHREPGASERHLPERLQPALPPGERQQSDRGLPQPAAPRRRAQRWRRGRGWLVRLHGEEIRDGSYDGWIERTTPRRSAESATRRHGSSRPSSRRRRSSTAPLSARSPVGNASSVSPTSMPKHGG